MNYVIAAWLSCGAILVAYAAADVATGAGAAAIPGTKGEAHVALSALPRSVGTGRPAWLRREAMASPAGPRSPHQTAGVGAPVLADPRRRRSLGTRQPAGIVVAAIIILGALGFLVARGLANAMNYYLTANQAVAQRAQLGGTDFRIQGTVLPGVHQVGTTLHFVITSKQR